MSPRTKKIALFASVLIAGLLTFGALAAHPAAMHHHGGVIGDFGFGHRAARALSALELTDEQKSQVKQVLRESGPAIEPLVDEVLRSKKALFETVHRARFDEQAVRDAAAADARAGTDLAIEKARIVSRVRGLLTAEQQDKLEAIHQEFEARFLRHFGLARDIWREHAEDFIDEL